MGIFAPILRNLTNIIETVELSSEPLQYLDFSTIIKSIKHCSCRNCKIGMKFPNVFVFLFLIPVISGIGFSHRGKYFFHRGRGIYLALIHLSLPLFKGKACFIATFQTISKKAFVDRQKYHRYNKTYRERGDHHGVSDHPQ